MLKQFRNEECQNADGTSHQKSGSPVGVRPESGEDGERSDDRVRELRDDKLAREAVVRFERAKGRKATPMDELQPGYDVTSDDVSLTSEDVSRGVTHL